MFLLKKKIKRINEFEIGYMNNPILHVDKSFRYQVEKYMNTRFVELTQSFIKAKLLKKQYNSVSINIFLWYKKRKPRNDFRVLSCVINTIIQIYVCIEYIACQSKIIIEITVGSRHG